MRKTNSYDYMRVFAAFAVVFLHTCAPSLHNYNSVPLGEWLSENALDSLVRWSVPVFFMLSGAFLLDPNKQESLPDLFKKRVPKIVIPLFVWSIVYYFAVVYGLHEKPLSFTQFITDFLNNDIINHLWFLYILLGLYLLTPILKIRYCQ